MRMTVYLLIGEPLTSVIVDFMWDDLITITGIIDDLR